jgi:predicted DNA-binding transcriptional regulator AlpA
VKTCGVEPPSDLIDAAEAARILGCHPKTLFRLSLAGRIPAWRREGSRKLFFSAAEVRALFRQRKATGAVPSAHRAGRQALEARRRRTEEVLRAAGLAG